METTLPRPDAAGTRPRRLARLGARLAPLLLHTGVLVGLYAVLYTLGIITQLPDNSNLLSWDADLFHRIAQTGYDDAASGINAFFPLLPGIWHFTGFSAIQISLLNATCLLAGMALLGWAFRLSNRQLLVALSGPLLLFGLVPYAEALFFLGSAVLLAGLHRQRLGLVVLGLVVACLARSAATLLIPSYLFAELLWWGRGHWRWAQLGRLLAGIAACLVALGGVMLLQYRSHGDALAFYKVHALWGHIWQPPLLPLHSSAGINVLWLDATALVVAGLSLLSCLVLGLHWLTSWRTTPTATAVAAQALPPSKAVLFSLSYCVGAGYFIVFYQAGDLVGLARYVLASPFFVVLFWQLGQLPRQRARQLAAAVLGAGLLAVLALGGLGGFNSFYPGQALVYFGLFLLYLLAYVAVGARLTPWFREAGTALYLVNCLVMLYLLDLFLHVIWIN
ncbi:hypothetical protein [Hymenobacter psychrophilus]|uniref:Mannosyltransferase (PIG-V) n=1 Tax=Hymenobacter psychrophilus TaxID=651662 RepID=A0A1H3HIJ5_9BACT|nr:hypothetical protein [Hymenobacter psychrophilus]SDY15366.1 hypothetical protein SAMN04488069_10614 [Hymenobacter psychrophilus]